MEQLDSFMVEHGCGKTTHDHYVFIRRFHNDNFIILLLYMDVMLFIGYNVKEIKNLNEELSLL